LGHHAAGLGGEGLIGTCIRKVCVVARVVALLTSNVLTGILAYGKFLIRRRRDGDSRGELGRGSLENSNLAAFDDLTSVDLTDLLFEIVRDRSVYEVLEALVNACERRARLIGQDLEKAGLDALVRAEYEKEMDFYEIAALHLRIARELIENDVRIRSRGPSTDTPSS
jgi:hypothetical protein